MTGNSIIRCEINYTITISNNLLLTLFIEVYYMVGGSYPPNTVSKIAEGGSGSFSPPF